MANPIEIEGFRTPGHTIHDVTLRDCTLPQDASIRLALYDELTLQNIHSAAELNKQKSRYGTNCVPYRDFIIGTSFYSAPSERTLS